MTPETFDQRDEEAWSKLPTHIPTQYPPTYLLICLHYTHNWVCCSAPGVIYAARPNKWKSKWPCKLVKCKIWDLMPCDMLGAHAMKHLIEMSGATTTWYFNKRLQDKIKIPVPEPNIFAWTTCHEPSGLQVSHPTVGRGVGWGGSETHAELKMRLLWILRGGKHSPPIPYHPTRWDTLILQIVGWPCHIVRACIGAGRRCTPQQLWKLNPCFREWSTK